MNLAQKLQIKPGKRWLFFNAPHNYLTVIEPLPDEVQAEFEPNGNFDGIQLFIKNAADLQTSLPIILPLLKPDTILWLTYPKKSSGMDSGLEMMGSWDELTSQGLRIVTSVSVNETWTALRFKPVELAKFPNPAMIISAKTNTVNTLILTISRSRFLLKWQKYGVKTNQQ